MILILLFVVGVLIGACIVRICDVISERKRFAGDKSKAKTSKTQKTLNIILIIVAITLLIFSLVMIWLFYMFQSVPDTLIVSIFGACTGELSICGWIRTTKDKLDGTNTKEGDSNDGDINCG